MEFEYEKLSKLPSLEKKLTGYEFSFTATAGLYDAETLIEDAKTQDNAEFANGIYLRAIDEAGRALINAQEAKDLVM